MVLCEQLGYVKEKKGWVSLDLQDEAKDLLYDKGWVFVKTNGYGGRVPFYSKWGELEDMPQRVMDTAYDYLVWAKEA